MNASPASVRTNKTATFSHAACVLAWTLLGGWLPFNATAQSNDNGFLWGVCGHPQFTDYQDANTYRFGRQLDYVQQLGCRFYRVSFDVYPQTWALGNVVPMAQMRGIQLLPVYPISITASSGYQGNYAANYQKATEWANYAISHGYQMPYWELGNELENWNLVGVNGDGAGESDWYDIQPGGMESIAGALNGAYQGFRDAYASARSSGTTSITPRLLFGATWRHWGLLNRIKNYGGNNFLPWDIISWHWYTPSFNDFTAVIPSGFSSGRTPVQCLNDFKKHDAPSEPMDIWITESGRSQNIPGYGFVGGSCTSTVNPAANQDFALQALQLESEIDNLKTVSSVKAVFVYELFNETSVFGANNAAEAYFGLLTGVDGIYKDAFYSFLDSINAYGNLNPFGAMFNIRPSSLPSDRILEVAGASENHQAGLIVGTLGIPPGASQQWMITPDGTDADGVPYYKITNLNSFKVLGVTASSPGAWTYVYQVDETGASAPALNKRRWYVSWVPDAYGNPTGYYHVKLLYNSALHLNLAQASGGGGLSY